MIIRLLINNSSSSAFGLLVNFIRFLAIADVCENVRPEGLFARFERQTAAC